MAREIGTDIRPKKFVIFRTSGIIPTVPNPPDLRKFSVGFKDTDLEIGEWARNIADGKLFFRNDSGIKEIPDDYFNSLGMKSLIKNVSDSVIANIGEIPTGGGSGNIDGGNAGSTYGGQARMDGGSA
jgi:hypothetical protein